uniref:RNA binding protein n=1 Tax=Pristionchus pacificus TaxID=54126 RepID=A0A2A6C688_PRIPA|eukprot:PDM73722.1 RNA binding protein [Pristionchus pacificus]
MISTFDLDKIFSAPADYDVTTTTMRRLGFGDVRKDVSVVDQLRNQANSSFKSPTVTASRAPSSRVYIGRIHPATTQEELEALFARAGTVVNVHIPFDKATGRPRGYAFCQYENEQDAREAIEMFNGYGRQLRVAMAN